MNFKEWYHEKVFDEFLLEVIQFINGANANASGEQGVMLMNNMKRQFQLRYSDRHISPRMKVDKMRHHFVNYDDEWRKIDNNKKQNRYSNPGDYVSAWNTMVQQTFNLINQLINIICDNAKDRTDCLIANKQWMKEKLLPIPQRRELPDDPLAFRRQRSAIFS